jgi:hypothetical protein
MENGQAVVRLQGATDEGAKAQATVIAPDNTSFDVDLSPVRPGEFEVRFPASQPGTYIIQAKQTQPGMPDVQTETGLSASWSREYDLRYDDPRPKLEEAARITGGKLVSSAEELFAQNMEMKKGRADLTGLLVLLALFLFLLDVAVRRMRWDARLLSWLVAGKVRAATRVAQVKALKSIPPVTVQKPIEEQPANEQEEEVKVKRVEPKKPAATASAIVGGGAQALLEKRKQQKR